MNGKDVMDSRYRTRLDNALAMNKPLAQAYYLKEDLCEIWAQPSKDSAEQVLLNWVEQARSSGQKQLMTMANTIMAHRTGILAWYDGHLSTARLEGINNKIKVLKRVHMAIEMKSISNYDYLRYMTAASREISDEP
jgi:transposase